VVALLLGAIALLRQSATLRPYAFGSGAIDFAGRRNKAIAPYDAGNGRMKSNGATSIRPATDGTEAMRRTREPMAISRFRYARLPPRGS
jgi:hypothetical protein